MGNSICRTVKSSHRSTVQSMRYSPLYDRQPAPFPVRIEKHQKAAHNGEFDPNCQACIDLREEQGEPIGGPIRGEWRQDVWFPAWMDKDERPKPKAVKPAKPEPRFVLDGLPPRLRQVAAMIGRGLRNREIGAALGVTEQVVKNYSGQIYHRTGMSDRLELAVALAWEGMAND